MRKYIEETVTDVQSYGKRVDACSVLFKGLEDAKEPGLELKAIVEETEEKWFNEQQKDNSSSEIKEMLKSILKTDEEEKSTDDEEEMKHDEEMKYYVSKYKRVAQALIDLSVGKGYKEKEYYSELWMNLSTIMASRSETEKGACLYAILIDNRTPYFMIAPGLQMSNIEYKEEIRKLKKEIDAVRFVFNLKNTQRTETASQLLDIIEKTESRMSKVVLLSRILAMVMREKKDEE